MGQNVGGAEIVNDRAVKGIAMRFIDLHCDTVSKLYDDTAQHLNANSFHVDIEKLKMGECFLQTFAVFLDEAKVIAEDGEMFVEWENRIALYAREMRCWGSQLAPIEQFCEEKTDTIYSLLSVEGCGFIQNHPQRLEEVVRHGCKMVSLTWNYENCMGYPNSTQAEQMAKGLKPQGFGALDFFNEKKIIIDISHLSDGGAEDVLKKSRLPVVASHSNARAVCRHPRNVSDRLVRKIADSGGVVGINFYPPFLTENKKATTEDVLFHMRHIINCGGEETVAFGTDYDGIESTPEDLEDVSKMQRVYIALKKDGFSESIIEKIFYKNALRVLKEYGV